MGLGLKEENIVDTKFVGKIYDINNHELLSSTTILGVFPDEELRLVKLGNVDDGAPTISSLLASIFKICTSLIDYKNLLQITKDCNIISALKTIYTNINYQILKYSEMINNYNNHIINRLNKLNSNIYNIEIEYDKLQAQYEDLNEKYKLLLKKKEELLKRKNGSQIIQSEMDVENYKIDEQTDIILNKYDYNKPITVEYQRLYDYYINDIDKKYRDAEFNVTDAKVYVDSKVNVIMDAEKTYYNEFVKTAIDEFNKELLLLSQVDPELIKQAMRDATTYQDMDDRYRDINLMYGKLSNTSLYSPLNTIAYNEVSDNIVYVANPYTKVNANTNALLIQLNTGLLSK